MATKFVQDAPPKGGYQKIDWQRPLAGKQINGWKLIGAAVALKCFGLAYYKYSRAKFQELELEMNDARIAIQPLVQAESDRLYLKHLRAMRDEEAELMKDVPGWKTGTLFGKPIYHNVQNKFILPDPDELLVHSDRFKLLLTML